MTPARGDVAEVFERAIEDSPIATGLLDAEGVYVRANGALTEMVGRRDLVGRHYLDPLHPDRRDFAAERFAGLRSGRQPRIVGETRYLRPDGVDVWAELFVTAVTGPGGSAPSHFLVQAQDVTTARQAAESQARLAAVVDGSLDAIYSKDLHGVITSWNRTAETFFGYRADEVIGRSAAMLYPPNTDAEAEENLARVRRGLGVGPYETTRVRRDGSELDVSVVLSPILAGDGSPVGASTIARDISEQKRSRRALKQSERRYRHLIESVHEGIWVFDRDGRSQLVNQRMADLLGVALVDLQQRTLADFIDGEWDPAAEPIGDAEQHEVRLRRANGDAAWVLVSRAALTDGDQRLGTIIAVADITARRRSEEMLRAVFDQTQDAMLVADDERRYLEANPAAERLLDRPLAEILRLRVEDISSPVVRDAAVGAFAEFRRAGHASGDYVVVRPDGEERTVSFAATANILPGRHLTVLRDVTAQRRADAERRELEVQLQQSQRLESVGRLAGGVAHDFNNLLSIILNYGEYARKRVTDAELRDELGEIVHAAERAAALTRQLLIFSRRDMVDPAVLDVCDAVRHTAALMRRTLGERIRVQTELPPLAMPVRLDRAQLDQVLVNLGLNARDAMPGGGSLTFRVSAVPPGADGVAGVRLRVTDTGTGMEDAVRERAFEPFFTTKPRDSGTGLGLSTIYGIVTQSDGQVTLHSTPGAGTSAEILWPRAPEDPAEPDLAVAVPPLLVPKAALVVEDEESLRRLIGRILTEHGYEVILCADADAALEAADAHPVDVLVTDVVMPGLQGPELAARIRARIPDLPVLFVSGYTDQGAMLREQDRLLEKPFTAQQLLEAITALSPTAAGEPR